MGINIRYIKQEKYKMPSLKEIRAKLAAQENKSKKTKLKIMKDELAKCIKERMDGLKSPDEVLVRIIRSLNEFLKENVLHTMTVSIVHDVLSKITIDYYKSSYSYIFRILLEETKKKS